MPTQESAPILAAEAKSLFSDLASFPALLLAVSGGPDSTALMVLAAHWRAALKRPPRLVAITIDHGLRKDSKAEAAAVARLARKLKIAHRTLRWRGTKPASGLQQAGGGAHPPIKRPPPAARSLSSGRPKRAGPVGASTSPLQGEVKSCCSSARC